MRYVFIFLGNLFDSLCLNLSFVLVWQEVSALRQDQLPESRSLKVLFFKCELYGAADDGLFLWYAHGGEKRVFKALLKRDPKKWVKDEHALEEVDRLMVATRVLVRQKGPWGILKLLQVLEGFAVSHETFVRFIWRPYDLEDDR